MDRKILLKFQSLWVPEPQDKRCIATLPNLTSTEQMLYQDLIYDRIGKQIRLEQERIAFHCLRDWLGSNI